MCCGKPFHYKPMTKLKRCLMRKHCNFKLSIVPLYFKVFREEKYKIVFLHFSNAFLFLKLNTKKRSFLFQLS